MVFCLKNTKTVHLVVTLKDFLCETYLLKFCIGSLNVNKKCMKNWFHCLVILVIVTLIAWCLNIQEKPQLLKEYIHFFLRFTILRAQSYINTWTRNKIWSKISCEFNVTNIIETIHLKLLKFFKLIRANSFVFTNKRCQLFFWAFAKGNVYCSLGYLFAF